MPTNTSRGRFNWARPAALNNPFVDAGFCDRLVPDPIVDGSGDIEDGTRFKVVCVDGSGLIVCIGVKVCVGGGSVVGGGLNASVDVGPGTLNVSVDVGAGTLNVSVDVGPGILIVVGPPTGPVHSCPLGQHPMILLLARKQKVVGSQQLPSLQQFHPAGQQPVASHTSNPSEQTFCRGTKRPRITAFLSSGL